MRLSAQAITFMRKSCILFLFILFHRISATACDCPPLPAPDLNYCNKFEIIFKGKIVSVSDCDGISSAKFRLSELYKGACTEEIQIWFDCSTDCMMSFNAGEEWIIYANFFQHGKPRAEFCSRCRKYISNENKIQTEFVNNDLSFDQENEFLKKELGLHHFLEVNTNADFTHQNTKPGGLVTILLIIASIGVLILFYYFFNKFFK
jgi:hypothetical protein